MDCIRVSLREKKDQEWDAFYYKRQFIDYSNTENGCRQSCISKLNCKAWKYVEGDSNGDTGECFLTYALRGYYPRSVKSKGSVSGLVQCRKSAWSMLKLILYLLLFVIIFAIFLWIISCPKK